MSGDTSSTAGTGARRTCDTGAVPVLMYHSIGGTDRLAVRPEAFAEQMAYLKDNGYTPLPFGARADAAERPVVITFDDGYADFHEHALPVLARFGFPATVFVTTGWLRDAGRHAAGTAAGPDAHVARRPPRSPPPGWRSARTATATHSSTSSAPRRCASELRRSRALLQDRLGRAVDTMAYPTATPARAYAARCAPPGTPGPARSPTR